MSGAQIALMLIALAAAVVNGALGHGFSSVTVPFALLFYTNRLLNPALVLVEVAINGYILFVNRAHLPSVWKRVLPTIAGLLPGIVAGTYLLSVMSAVWLKLLVFVVLLPLILLQAAGVRRPIRREGAVGPPFGAGVGILYSVTTVSGPPLALMFNNQGLAKHEFRAALGLIRVVESLLTAIVYYVLGVYTGPSVHLLLAIVPSVAIGLPVGAALIARVDPEVFRRLCMSFDAWIVGFGLSRILVDLELLTNPFAYGLWGTVVVVDAHLLYVFFSRRGRGRPIRRAPRAPGRPGSPRLEGSLS